jgi:hypothetical protein
MLANKSRLQLLLQLVRLRFLFPQLFDPSRRPARDGSLTTKCLERIVEDPFGSVLDRLIESEGQKGDCCKTKL